MAVFEATIRSDWTADDTFGYLAVFSNAEEWDPGVLAGEQLDPGPVRVGSRFRLVVPFLGRTLALVYRVTEFSADDRRVVLDAASRFLRATDRIAVRPGPTRPGSARPGSDRAGSDRAGSDRAGSDRAGSDRAGSAVSYQAEVTLAGPMRLLDPVLGRGFRAVGERAAAGLASTLASAHAARTP